MLNNTYREIYNGGPVMTLGVLEKLITSLPSQDFKILMYLYIKTSLEQPYYLSSKILCQECNISRPTYSKTFSNLVEQGYLVEQQNNSYILSIEKE